MIASLPTGQEALLRAIVAQPDDDLVRLAYADWLEEHGDTEQAAFIRSSLKLHALPPDDTRRPDLATELDRTGEQKGKEWLAALGVPSANELDPKFHRGCIEGIECQSFEPLFGAGTMLFELFPIREFCFWWQYSWGLDAEALGRLTELPGLDRLRMLRLANYDSELARTENVAETWGEFFRCPRLSGLRFLGIDATRLTDADVEAIVASPSLANLTTLTLEQNRISGPGVRAILRSPHLRGLRRLSLGGNLRHYQPDYEALRQELEARFPGQNSLELLIDMEWFQH